MGFFSVLNKKFFVKLSVCFDVGIRLFVMTVGWLFELGNRVLLAIYYSTLYLYALEKAFS